MEVARVFELLDAQPSVPFDVDLENGRRIPVTRPENGALEPAQSLHGAVFFAFL
jgi:hypothetical protein